MDRIDANKYCTASDTAKELILLGKLFDIVDWINTHDRRESKTRDMLPMQPCATEQETICSVCNQQRDRMLRLYDFEKEGMGVDEACLCCIYEYRVRLRETALEDK